MLNPNEFRVVSHLKAKPETAEELRQRLFGMMILTRAEEGCLLYDFHEVEGNPDEFLFFERWTSKEAHHKHLETPHFQKLIAILPNLVVRPPHAYHLKQIG